MSRKYDGLIVLNTKGQEDSVETLATAIGKDLEAEGAKLEEVKHMGRREFAYNAQKLEAGHYVNFFFEANPTQLNAIQDRLKLNDVVHQQYYQRLS